MSVPRWDPFRELASIQDEMNQTFDRMLGRRVPGGGDEPQGTWTPAVDISERMNAYVVTAEVPGVKPEDLNVTFEDGLLTIQGERRLEQETPERQYHRVERRYGNFRRSIILPGLVEADAIEANYSDGLLQVLVPKSEETKPKRITVSAKPPGPGTSDDDDVFEMRPPGPGTSDDDNVLGEG